MLHADNAATISETLLRRAAELPDRLLYEFSDGAGTSVAVTYGELSRRVAGVAESISWVTSPGDRVLVLCPNSDDFLTAFLACLHTGRIAVPAHVPFMRKVDGLARIALDSGAVAAISTMAAGNPLRAAFAVDLALRGVRWLFTDGVIASADVPLVPAELDDIAFLQYTSGSTGNPRGVEIRHCNLVRNLDQIRRALGLSSSSRAVTWLPPHHDMGLIACLLAPLHVGLPITVLPPTAFLRDPATWLRTIARTGATASGAPTFAYDLCVRRISRETAATLDLSSWQLAFVGAEPVDPAVLARFVKHFAISGFRPESFYPCYGLAESVVFVSGGPVGAGVRTRLLDPGALEAGRVEQVGEGGRAVASCGPTLETRVAVVDPETSLRCPPGRIGEIWLAGASVTAGYWNQSAEAPGFRARIAGEPAVADGYLRTGDLGFVHDGEIYITGRRKDMIIIRGRNIYPHDVERAVTAECSDVRHGGCVVFVVDGDNEERLVVMVEVDGRTLRSGTSNLEERITDMISREFQVGVHRIVPVRSGHIPRTTSGKPRRAAARAAFRAEQGSGVSL